MDTQPEESQDRTMNVNTQRGREFFRDFLRRVLVKTSVKKACDNVACAELKMKLQRAAYEDTPTWEFDEKDAAKILHPGKDDGFYLDYRFRDFCQDFQDILVLTPSPSGDFVKLNSPLSSDEVRVLLNEDEAHAFLMQNEARVLLKQALRDFYIETGKFDIACSALKVRMNKASQGAFNEKTLGFRSFQDYLSKQPDIVRFMSHDSGGRVQFFPPEDAVAKTAPADISLLRQSNLDVSSKSNVAQRGYLLVDGDNVRSTIFKLLRSKPEYDQLPRWELVLQGIKKGPLPALEWKAIYFLGIHGTLSQSATNFRHSLSTAGYEVVSVKCEADANEGIQTEKALLKTLEALSTRGHHVVVVSHSSSCGRLLTQIMRNHTQSSGSWGVIGLKELMAPEIHDAAKLGVTLLDLERDFASIPSALPRHIEISADEFNPEDVLN